MTGEGQLSFLGPVIPLVNLLRALRLVLASERQVPHFLLSVPSLLVRAHEVTGPQNKAAENLLKYLITSVLMVNISQPLREHHI